MENRCQPPVRGRFAPTPSGRLHLGNLACSLLAWLSAKSQNGSMILRIEDLDPARSRAIYTQNATEDLAFLGLTWQEGGALGGAHEPYTQSMCDDIYTESYQKLVDLGHVYPCFCSRGELHTANAPHNSDGTFIYHGGCYGMSAQERAQKAQQKKPSMRLHVPARTISFTDGNLGAYQEYLPTECGDFIVRRGDGVFAYQLAVVVDDARMGITQVVRGADLLASSARQLLLYELLGLQAPQFYHCPLLLAPGGRRLSKRDGDDSLEHLAMRYTAEQIVGKLAYVYGLQPQPEPRSAQSLVQDFAWQNVKKQDVVLPDNLF